MNRFKVLLKFIIKVQCEPILGWYHWESRQGMVKEPKIAKSFFLALLLNVFTTMIFFFMFINCIFEYMA